jgi:hypothetical protein
LSPCGWAWPARRKAWPLRSRILGQNEAQSAKYEALGYDPASAHDLILARFDYSFSVGALLTMIAVILLYYFLILRFSEVEYREVISEKFGE